MATTATTTSASGALEKFALLESSRQLSIIQHAESINGQDSEHEATGQTSQSGGRTSDASSHADETSTPASLAADLSHYKELFSKLRFSYIEQVTKERFLRAITSPVPLFIEPADNIALESQLASEKILLKQQKTHVAELTQSLEQTGRELVRRWQALNEQREILSEMPGALDALRSEIDELRGLYPSPRKNEDAQLNLPLAETLSLLSQKQKELAEIDAEIASLSEELPATTRELERLDDESIGLAQQKKMKVGRAREARERKEQGGMDEVERRGRWLRTSDLLLREVFDV